MMPPAKIADEPERYHIFKDGEGEPEHTLDIHCFCQPYMHYVDIESGIAVYVHRERSEMLQ